MRSYSSTCPGCARAFGPYPLHASAASAVAKHEAVCPALAGPSVAEQAVTGIVGARYPAGTLGLPTRERLLSVAEAAAATAPPPTEGTLRRAAHYAAMAAVRAELRRAVRAAA